ncbi:MAG: ferredoxin family protein [Candidatus Adiutrix sp.]|jgi:adenylylsulfate reductase subunit B|nr:ferredoxin family protein [Candidatus Adiutrix sp.]
MSISIDQVACTGCGRCGEICPGSLIRADREGKAEIGQPADCWSCTACLKECPAGAIALYLPPVLGGSGTRLQVKQEGSLLHWRFTRPDGTLKTITVDRQSANRY